MDGFSNGVETDMKDLLDFIAQFEWLFNFKVTDFFVGRVWEKAPIEWLKSFENLSSEDLDGLPFGSVKDSYPGSLREFITQALKYSLPREIHTFKSPCLKLESGTFKPVHENDIPSHIRKGMSEKKLHEVCHLASLINAVSEECQAECLVDVGSGLGYLGQVLHTLFQHKMLGLEGKQSHASGAEKRTVDNHTECPHLQNRTCELYPSDESETQFKIVLSDWLSSLPPGGECVCLNKSGSQNTGALSVNENCSREGGKANCLNGLSSQNFQGLNLNEERTCTNKFDKHNSEMKEMTGCSGVSMETSRNCMKDNLNSQPNNDEKERLQSCPQNVSVESQSSDTRLFTQSLESTLHTGQTNSFIQGNETYNSNESHLNSDLHTHRHSKGAPIMTPVTPTTPICMVGLHCCGDLTPTMLQYFSKMEFIKAVCLVSCCYHRMEYKDEECRFTNFPLSRCVNQSLSQTRGRYPGFNFTPYSMRLAAQETRARWKSQTPEDHGYHVRNVAYRGILELALKEGSFKLKKTSRKMVHRGDYCSFERYVTAVNKHIDVPAEMTSGDYLQLFQSRMNQLHKEYEHYFVYIEPITALQFLLQPVLESFVYIDRLTWLQEQGFEGEIIPVFDEFVSPRNLALMAIKR